MKKQEECRILAEVTVPYTDQTYDFWLDAGTPFGELAAEMADAVRRMEQGRQAMADSAEKAPLLCCLQDEKLLPASQSPLEFGMKSGASLLLL